MSAQAQKFGILKNKLSLGVPSPWNTGKAYLAWTSFLKDSLKEKFGFKSTNYNLFFNYSSSIYCWFWGITNSDGPDSRLISFFWRHSIVCSFSGIYYYCRGYHLLLLPSKRSQMDPWTKRPNSKRKMGEKDRHSKILKNEKKNIVMPNPSAFTKLFWLFLHSNLFEPIPNMHSIILK